jgi:hypothetical protein
MEADVVSCSILRQRPGGFRGLTVLVAISLGLSGALAAAKAPTALATVSWYGDPSAPNLSGVWLRADEQILNNDSPSFSKEGWRPWPPPLKDPYARIWRKRVSETASGTRTDDPIVACLPPGMPRFMSGTKGPLLIVQTPGRVTLHRDGWSSRRIWLDGRSQPPSKDLEDFYNGNSIGRYEGATLVIETIGVKEQPIDGTGVPHSEQLKIVERLTRLDDETLRVSIELHDPASYKKPMKSLIIYKALNDPLWEPKDLICSPKTDYHSELFVK